MPAPFGTEQSVDPARRDLERNAVEHERAAKLARDVERGNLRRALDALAAENSSRFGTLTIVAPTERS